MFNDTMLELSELRQRELRDEAERDARSRVAESRALRPRRRDPRLTLAHYLHVLAARLEAGPVALKMVD
jgi:hypothetical protein